MFRRLLAGVVLAVPVLSAPAPAAEVDPLLPAETESVLYVNVRQMLGSDLVKRFALGQVKQALAGSDAKKTLEKLGLDPLKDVDRVTAGFWGKDKDDMKGVFVVRGTFDPEKLFKAAQEEAKTNGDKVAIDEDKESGYKLVKVTADNQPRPYYLSLADDKTIVGGTDKKLAIAALNAAKAKGKPAVKKDLQALLLKQDEKATMYVVGVTDGKGADGVQIPPGIPGIDPDKLAKQLAELRTMALTVRLAEDVSLDVAMGMKDADAADALGDTLAQLVMTAKQFLPLAAAQNPNAKPLVDEVSNTLKSKVKEKDVTLTLKVTGDAIGKMVGAGD